MNRIKFTALATCSGSQVNARCITHRPDTRHQPCIAILISFHLGQQVIDITPKHACIPENYSIYIFIYVMVTLNLLGYFFNWHFLILRNLSSDLSALSVYPCSPCFSPFKVSFLSVSFFPLNFSSCIPIYFWPRISTSHPRRTYFSPF